MTGRNNRLDPRPSWTPAQIVFVLVVLVVIVVILT